MCAVSGREQVKTASLEGRRRRHLSQPASGRHLRITELALLICSVLLAFPAAADDAELGREIYGEFCVNCHGRDMVSSGTMTSDLRKFPKNDFARFRNSVLNGKGQAMPPWRDKLSDEDLTLLWAYVRSGG
jgi:cytochrome c553